MGGLFKKLTGGGSSRPEEFDFQAAVQAEMARMGGGDDPFVLAQQGQISTEGEVDRVGPSGRTALQGAAQVGNLEGVRALVARGAQVNFQDDNGWTATMLAATGKAKTALGPNGLEITFEPETAQPEVVRFLAQQGADPALRTGTGDTALHVAARVGRLGVLKALLEVGFDRSLRNEDGQTPLELARAEGQAEAARLLGG